MVLLFFSLIIYLTTKNYGKANRNIAQILTSSLPSQTPGGPCKENKFKSYLTKETNNKEHKDMTTQLTLGPGSPCLPISPLGPRLPFTAEPKKSLSDSSGTKYIFFSLRFYIVNHKISIHTGGPTFPSSPGNPSSPSAPYIRTLTEFNLN